MVCFELVNTGLNLSGLVLAGQNWFEPVWSLLNRSEPVCGPVLAGLCGSGPVSSGFTWSGSVESGLMRSKPFEPVKTGLSRSGRV